jgi:magnesium transporter
MIRACHFTAGQKIRTGDASLIEQWRQQGGYIWLDIQQSLSLTVEKLLAEFEAHDLAIKDIRRERHPPKVEVFDEHTFVIFRGVKSIDNKLNIKPLQMSFFVGENYLITVHPEASLSIEHHFAQINDYVAKTPKGLAASIMHYSCGRYLETLLEFDNELVELEDDMLNRGSDTLLKDLIRYRSQLRKMRRTFDYHEKLSEELIDLWDENQDQDAFSHDMRNLYDRCERLASLSSQQYEICGDLVDGYFSLTSHQLNNTMRILTLITAIFVPLSFLAGLYGMNFEYIPELKFKEGYFVLLSVMLLLAAAMIVIFKRKKWF